MKLRNVFVALTVGLCVGISGNTLANSYNKGFVAAEAGKYQTALQQWGPMAEKGHPIAQFNVAMLFHSGSGVAMNEAKALEWYIKSADGGYYKAQEYLAVGYSEGWFGLPRDSKKAAYWEKRLESGK